MREVKELAGYPSIQTTEKYYVRADRSAVDRAREASESESLCSPQTQSGPIEGISEIGADDLSDESPYRKRL
jgi:hypothetical protein